MKADNKNLRLDFEKTTHALRVEIDNVTVRNRKAIMKHVNELDVRIKKVECAVAAVPDVLDAVMKAVDKGSTELKGVDAKVKSNCISIQHLRNSMKSMGVNEGVKALRSNPVAVSSKGN